MKKANPFSISKPTRKIMVKRFKNFLTKAKVGVEYDSKDLIEFEVPKQFASKISSYNLKSNSSAEIT